MPRIRSRRRFFLLAVAVAACTTGDPITLCGCQPTPLAAVMHGRVTDAAGNPVAGATVEAEHAAAGCGEHLERIGSVETGADGRYEAIIAAHRTIVQPGNCLRASAAPPAGSGLSASDTVPFSVFFSQTDPLDSVQVDLVLRAP
jgi:hypothetical protein